MSQQILSMDVEKADEDYKDGIGVDILYKKITCADGEESDIVMIPHHVGKVSYSLNVTKNGGEGSVFTTNAPRSEIEAATLETDDWEENTEGSSTSNLFGNVLAGVSAIKCKSVSGEIYLRLREGKQHNS